MTLKFRAQNAKIPAWQLNYICSEETTNSMLKRQSGTSKKSSLQRVTWCQICESDTFSQLCSARVVVQLEISEWSPTLIEQLETGKSPKERKTQWLSPSLPTCLLTYKSYKHRGDPQGMTKETSAERHKIRDPSSCITQEKLSLQYDSKQVNCLYNKPNNPQNTRVQSHHI